MKKRHLLGNRVIFFLRNLMIGRAEQGKSDSLLYWRQFIFVSLMSAIILLGIGALVSGMRQFISDGMASVAFSIFGIYLFFCFMAFARFIPYSIRQNLIGWIFYLLSILIFLFTGPRGAGQFYLCTALVLLLIFSETTNRKYIMIINIFVFIFLTLVLRITRFDALLLNEYEGYWPIIVINGITVSLFINQMIGLLLTGLNRRFMKAKRVNEKLIEIQNDNLKQIKLLNSLRQSGMCAMETRLTLDERLQLVLETMAKELNCSASSLSLSQHKKKSALCIASQPGNLKGSRFPIPEYSGPYLNLDLEQCRQMAYPSPLMEEMTQNSIYFGGHFYTPEATGFLELLLNRQPEEAELNFLQMNIFQISAAITNDQLIQDIQRSHDILEGSYDEILQAWARILELRDIETKGHCSRVVSISLNIADMVNLPEDEKVQLKRGAFLHDIGKLGIPDRILKKEGGLSEEEWILMRRHPEIGRDSVKNIPFLSPAVPVIYHHHERWDGKGYPEGLKGEEIPYAARIFMIADVYDALISDRPYRKAMKQDEIVDYMRTERGIFFDPELLDIFLANVGALTVLREDQDVLV